MRQFDEIMRIHECNDPSYYNDDENYDLATAEAIGMKSQAVNKLAVYFRYLCGGNAQITEDISLQACLEVFFTGFWRNRHDSSVRSNRFSLERYCK